MRKGRYIIIQTTVLAVLVIVACTKPDRSEETKRLQDELTEMGVGNSELAVERVDSAERAGVFTTACANNVKAVIYENAGQRRMAAYYAERAG